MLNRLELFKSYIRIRLSRKCTFSFAERFFTLTGGMKMQHKYKPWPMSQQIMLGSVNKSRHISFASKMGIINTVSSRFLKCRHIQQTSLCDNHDEQLFAPELFSDKNDSIHLAILLLSICLSLQVYFHAWIASISTQHFKIGLSEDGKPVRTKARYSIRQVFPIDMLETKVRTGSQNNESLNSQQSLKFKEGSQRFPTK